MLFSKSNLAFQNANQHLVGGVNSPARAFKAVHRSPVFIEKAEGAKIIDLDGNEYIDYICSWGAIILGHADKSVQKKVTERLALGSSFGAPTLLETTMATLVKKCLPFADKVRMVNSGTEATFSAIRLARGYTKKNKILKFKGCYHGHGDSFLIAAGSGALTLGKPNSPGIPPSVAKETLLAEYNNFDEVEEIFAKYKNDLAAVIIEPVAGNMGLIKAEKKFLQKLRAITKENNTLLIFDEVMTGFRLALGGASELFKIYPDIICLGKVIGGGFPVGAFAGKKEVMEHLSPEGPVYQAGTLSGNPVAMAAGISVLERLIEKNIYDDLEKKAGYLEKQIRFLIKKYHLTIVFNRVGSMFTLFFNPLKEVTNFSQAQKSQVEKFSYFFNKLLEKRVYFPPSQFEATFLNQKHSLKDINKTLNAMEAIFKGMVRE